MNMNECCVTLESIDRNNNQDIFLDVDKEIIDIINTNNVLDERYGYNEQEWDYHNNIYEEEN